MTAASTTLERVPATRSAARQPIAPIPLTRITAVELRKMFDTRSGFWLMASVVIASVVATGAVIIFAPDENIVYDSFAAAIGFPMSVILPMIAVLSVTSEWSQRSGLTTFTLVPHRSRVITAKLIATLIVAVASMLIAMVVGALGNLLGAAIVGVDTVWDTSVADLLNVVAGNVLGMLIGFMLGVLIRNSAGAIVGYFVFTMLLPTISGVLGGITTWFADLQPWVDFNLTRTWFFDGGPQGSEQWAQLGVTGLIWLVIPLIVGLVMVLRSEVK